MGAFLMVVCNTSLVVGLGIAAGRSCPPAGGFAGNCVIF